MKKNRSQPPFEKQSQQAITQESASNASSTHEITNEQIAERAYELWEKSGSTHGDDQRHWLEAEQQLRGSSGNVSQRELEASERGLA